ncbi:MAG: hypothetical protein ACLSHU_03620 [Oscillospiraceae bacterium]
MPDPAGLSSNSWCEIFAAYLVTSHGCTIRYFSNPIVTSSVQYLDLGKWSVPITIVWIA